MDNFSPLDGKKSHSQRKSSSNAWEPISPVPDGAPAYPIAHPTRGRPSALWEYINESGQLLMIVCRFDRSAGGKDICTLTYCQRGDLQEWRWKALPGLRPLYGLDRLSARLSAPVLICEGEKAVDAASELFPDYVVVCWPNGSSSVKKTDWRPLTNRDIILWPDADSPGADAMDAVIKCLSDVSIKSLRRISPPENATKSWDAADALIEIQSGFRTRDAVFSLAVDAIDVLVTGQNHSNKRGLEKGEVTRNRQTNSQLVAMVGDIELWHTPAKEAWATIHTGQGFTNYPLHSNHFENWLIHRIIVENREIPGKEALGKLLATLNVRAIFDGPEHKTHIRVAGELKEAIYFDLGRPDGIVVRLSPDGWTLESKAPFKFQRASGMCSLPLPGDNGSIELLRDWIKCQSEEDWMLCLAWIMAAMCSDGPYPVLVLSGPPGAAKSTSSKFIRSLIDPSIVPLSRMPKDPRDLYASVQNSRVLVYDNVSKIPSWLSDDLCMIATGGGVRERQLHTNAGEVMIEGGRPVIVNGIGDLATRSDLADRSLLVNLVPPTERRAEYRDTNENKALWPEFEADLSQLLGGLCGIFCAMLRYLNEGQPTPSGNPRMMDFAILGNALGAAMGWESDAFDNAYKGNRIEADDVALEDCPIWEHLQNAFLTGEEQWSGSATELKNKLIVTIDGSEKRKKMNSMQPSSLAQHLQRIMPMLNKIGWVVRKAPRQGSKRLWIIKSPIST